MENEIFTLFNQGVNASLTAHQHRVSDDAENAAKSEESAIAAFDAVLALDPTHAGALGGKGMSLAHLGRTQEAVTAFEQALQHEPSNHENYRQLGLCHIELGDMQKAWIVTQKAISMNDTAEYRAQASSEVCGVGRRILWIYETHGDPQNSEQAAMYYRWAASTFALASETDPQNEEARSLFHGADTKVKALDPSA